MHQVFVPLILKSIWYVSEPLIPPRKELILDWTWSKIKYENIEINTINKKAKNTKNNESPATNSWQKKVDDIRTVIPKSGCIIINIKSKKKKIKRIGK